MRKRTSSPFRRGRNTATKKWRRRPKKRYRAATNSTEGTKNSEAARGEEIAFDRARAEESAARARSHKSRSMAGYKTRTENNPEEVEEEENLEGNHKQPETNPIGGSRGWEKEIAVRARSKKRGNLAGYAMGISNKPEKEEE